MTLDYDLAGENVSLALVCRAGLLERRGHHVVGQAADTPELTDLVDALDELPDIVIIGAFYLMTLILGYGAAALVGPDRILAAPGGACAASTTVRPTSSSQRRLLLR